MDRNIVEIHPDGHVTVALRKESVDRNPTIKAMRGDRKVALRKESVDRNQGPGFIRHGVGSRSPQGERG